MQFIDLKTQYQRIKPGVLSGINNVLEHGQYILGPEIAELEKKLAEFCGVRHCLSCSSGTDALLLSMMAYGVGPGDAVLTTPFSFFATAETIALLGAVPVFSDVDINTFNIDPDKLNETIENFVSGKHHVLKENPGLKLKGIIPVDLFGLPADYSRINKIAEKHGLFVLEDAAQSFGAECQGKKAGSFGDIAAASFFPAKPLGCYGDGGAVFTNDDTVFEKLVSLRVHGQGVDRYQNIHLGINGRMDTIQAAVLLEKLKIFPEEVQLRQTAANYYSEKLREFVALQHIPEDSLSVWAQYTLLSDNRVLLSEQLKKRDIPTAVYYPIPLHLQKAFEYLGYKAGALPVSEELALKVISLPMSPYIKKEEQKEVINTILEIM